MDTKDTFIEIVKQNEGIIFKITKAYATHKEEQKDLYQEIVYQLWKSFSSFRGKSKISTWIYRVALNTSLTYYNQQKRKGYQVAVDDAMMRKMDDQDDEVKAQIDTLYTYIRTLNIADRGLILLFLEGKSYNEIAAITGFTSTNVGTRLSRIKQKLKSQIKK